jgi:hypothetical protein
MLALDSLEVCMRSRLLTVGLLAVFVGITALAQTKPAPTAPAKAAQTAPKVGPVAPPTTDADKIKSALSAAPASIAKDATVMDMPSMKVLKQGTNGWTCIPDSPSPGVDPMCVDKNGMEWAQAWMSHKDPPPGKMALGYMLMGGSDASNTDPFATEPKPGEKWVDTGPHIMVLNIADHFAGYPTTATNTKVPYVMFAGTPYAHLMIPIK